MKNKYATIKYEFTPEFIQYLRKTVGSMPPETGLIGGSSDGYHIDRAYFDSTAQVTGSTYTPDKEAVNAVLELWSHEDVSFLTVAHSHPEAANENCKKVGYKIMSMDDAISEINGFALPCDTLYPMYVGTNPERILGASILMYETYLEDLATQLEDDLCIMPSSIHELIVAPLSCIDPGYALKTVREVNEGIVGVEETLSNNIYFYRRNEHKLSLVTTHNLNNFTC